MPMRIELPDRWVQGVALAGLPGITLGQNDRIAWGFTNLGTDVADLFREPAISERVEQIAVKGAAAETLRVKLGRHGPQWREGYSLHWAPLDPRNLRSPIAAIDLATDWASFNAAVDQFKGPAQNIVYADVDGHIGYRASGLIPLRPAGDDGSLPRDGSSDWSGYVPQAEMPRVLDPPQGYLATANQRVIGSSFPHVVTTDWASPTRAHRIAGLIERAGKLDRAGMEAIQLDIVSDDDLELVRFHPEARRFDGWDGEARADSRLFLEAYAWENAVRELLRKKVLGPLAEDFNWSNDSATLSAALAADQAAWTRAGLGDRAQFLQDAAASAKAWLAAQRAADWGAFDALHILHPFGRAGGVLGLLFNPPSAPQSGASRTVRVARPAFGQSMRLVVDLADPLATTLVIPLGVSGHLGSAHRFDQQRDWLYGDPSGERTRLLQPAVGRPLVFNP
jgi:penicillin amidase